MHNTLKILLVFTGKHVPRVGLFWSRTILPYHGHWAFGPWAMGDGVHAYCMPGMAIDWREWRVMTDEATDPAIVIRYYTPTVLTSSPY